jgi:Tfp pilus assembly protein PilO
MSTLSTHQQSGFGVALRQFAMQPVSEWSARRTMTSALVLAVAILCAGAGVEIDCDLSGVEAGRTALAALEQRVGHAQAVVDTLPSLRARIAREMPSRAHWSTADALHEISGHAATSGLRMSAIEPARTANANPEGQRVLRLRADGSFEAIRQFLASLGTLPRLVALETVQVKRAGTALAVEAALHVHDDLPSVVSPGSLPASGGDPFGGQQAATTGMAPPVRLVGTFLRPRRAMALVQTEANIAGFEPGQMIGNERLGGVQPRAIRLGRANGTARTVAFEEDRS